MMTRERRSHIRSDLIDMTKKRSDYMVGKRRRKIMMSD